jgi:hypothetical protein
MVHMLLGASLLLFVLWFAGLVGVFDVHTAWILLVIAWWLGMAWSYAYYYTSVVRPHHHPHHPHHH